MVSSLEQGCAVSEEGENLVTNIGREALIVDNLGQSSWMEVVIEPQDVEQEEGPCVVGGAGSLDAVYESCDRVDGGVIGTRPKLGHREEAMAFDISVNAVSNEFLQNFTRAL